VLAGDAELLETQRAGLEEPLEISADGFIELRGVRLYALPYAAQELHHADLGCSAGILDSSHRNGTGEATRDGWGKRFALIGLSVEASSRRREGGAAREMQTREPWNGEGERGRQGDRAGPCA
jgi:hypothetical protein